MPLYLTGGGDQEDFRNLDRFFLDALPKGASMLVVPMALDEEDYEDAIERAEDCFAGKVVTDFTSFEEGVHDQKNALMEFDAVFIEGGNTFQLIRAVRRSAFFGLLADFLHQGGHIYADSAGAIVLGSHVKSAFLGEEADEDLEKLQDYRGLDLLPPFALHCHHDPATDHEGLMDLLYEQGAPILALAEPSGLYVHDQELRVFGKSPLEVFSFTAQLSYAPGQQLQLADLLAG